MIVVMQARYAALHYDDAVAQGLNIWRDFIGDPDAVLPWNASIRVELGEDYDSTATGEIVSRRPIGEAVLSVKIEREEK